MSKGLEALKRYRHIHDMECGEDESANKDFDIIEKELKAFEIIKKYYSPKEDEDDLIPYYLEEHQYVSLRSGHLMTKEEYELLKEVLL